MSDFKSRLINFQKSVVEDWLTLRSQLIGISIQLDTEVQSPESITRACDLTGENTIINHHCLHILKASQENITKCNGLDYHMKNYFRTNELKIYDMIACKCHAGVSNVLFTYAYKGQSPTWYIFIGQFLLKEPTSSLIFYKQVFQELERADQLLPELYISSLDPFCQDDDHVTKTSSKIPTEGRDSISYISCLDFAGFKSFLTSRFDVFLSDFYRDAESRELLQRFVSERRIGESFRFIRFGLEHQLNFRCNNQLEKDRLLRKLIKTIDARNKTHDTEYESSFIDHLKAFSSKTTPSDYIGSFDWEKKMREFTNGILTNGQSIEGKKP